MLNKIILFLSLIIGVSLAGGAFYWFELRPIQIKKECSWVIDTKITVRSDPGQTQEAADEENKRLNAENKRQFPNGCSDINPRSLDGALCRIGKNHNTATARPPQEEKTESYTRSATDSEYKECLRHNGLN